MAKLIPNPNRQEIAAGRTKVFDTWLANSPDPNNPSNPMYKFHPIHTKFKFFENLSFIFNRVGNLGGGSDFLSFAYVVGMPCADFGYTVGLLHI